MNKSGKTLNESNGTLHTLSIAALNVCGLKRRSLYPEFVNLVKSHDIFLLSETKVDEHDIIDIDGYTFFSKPRKQKYIRKSGGVGVLIKESVAKYVDTIDSNSEYIMWIKLKPQCTNLETDIVLGIVYVPPMHSRFYNDDEFELFESDIFAICSEYEHVYISGDFNAQTAEMQDYTKNDDFLSDFFHFDNDTISFFDQRSKMENSGISLERKSHDKKINNHGYKLIDLCKINNVFIINGRLGNKPSNLTFRNVSLIDYLLSSISAYKFLYEFNVTNVDSLMSDGHSLITFKLIINQKITHDTSMSKPKNPKWDQTLSHTFNENISFEDITATVSQMQASNPDDVDQNMIDNVTSKLSDIFIQSAQKTFPDKKSRNKAFKSNYKKPCNCGVRQGENLSPLLFSLFLNDLEEYLDQKGNSGIKMQDNENDLVTWLKIIVLLYADDTVLVSDNADDLQKCLNDFNDYCKTWNLVVNKDKTKIIVFGARNNANFSFKIDNSTLEVVDSYKYLGVRSNALVSLVTGRGPGGGLGMRHDMEIYVTMDTHVVLGFPVVSEYYQLLRICDIEMYTTS
ncbi:uncharacterized protein LOC128558990 [Mercenaria mercenaria]|uniref:uncharacterized protein LOC128558990 n=1 Tax=Mercenaria mercenaria TaxID=6596 RepID=UPI00234F1DDB|nr:uncharacterized protein LOC128558990 [Mercenaria mercenaria]